MTTILKWELGWLKPWHLIRILRNDKLRIKSNVFIDDKTEQNNFHVTRHRFHSFHLEIYVRILNSSDDAKRSGRRIPAANIDESMAKIKTFVPQFH